MQIRSIVYMRLARPDDRVPVVLFETAEAGPRERLQRGEICRRGTVVCYVWAVELGGNIRYKGDLYSSGFD